MEREWRAVVGAEPDYLVSDDGHVMTRKGSGNGSKGRKPKVARCAYGGTSGYMCFSMYGNSVNAAKVVAEAFVENPQEFKHIYYMDGDKENIRADNLEWAEFSFNKERRLREQRIVEERLEKVRAILLEHDSERESPIPISSSPKGAWMDSPNRVIGKILTNEYHIIRETEI